MVFLRCSVLISVLIAVLISGLLISGLLISGVAWVLGVGSGWVIRGSFEGRWWGGAGCCGIRAGSEGVSSL
ncbi:MAG: hypothetical protein EBX39_03080 [Actinobacteria bacterium]|nr:hypothetical protein [Actinomycetota bacterium]